MDLLQSHRDVWPCGEPKAGGLKDQVKIPDGWEEVDYEKSFCACEEVGFKVFKGFEGL